MNQTEGFNFDWCSVLKRLVSDVHNEDIDEPTIDCDPQPILCSLPLFAICPCFPKLLARAREGARRTAQRTFFFSVNSIDHFCYRTHFVRTPARNFVALKRSPPLRVAIAAWAVEVGVGVWLRQRDFFLLLWSRQP